MCRETAVSPLVQVANQRLHQLRAQLQQSNKKRAQLTQDAVENNQLIPKLPSHLGWHSATLAKVLMRSQPPHVEEPEWDAPLPNNEEKEEAPSPVAVFIRVYPDIVLASMKADLESVARVWFLAKHLDAEGSGFLYTANLKEKLTDKTSNLFLFGQRRLRTLLAEGEGTFWVRDKQHRIWLRSYKKVALHFNLSRLTLKPVELPLESLTKNIFTARSWFYASFHMGRANAPISRAAIEKITGIDAQTQRKYETEVGIKAKFNYAIAENASPEAVQEHAWQRGGGSFTFKDTKGYHGAKMNAYIAWQLPNTYEIDGHHCSRGMQKRINNSLKHLLMEKGTTGKEQRVQYARTYFSTAKTAVLSKQAPIKYWERKDFHRSGFWQVVYS